MRTGDAPDFRVEVRRRIRGLAIAGEREAAIVEEVAADLEARFDALRQQGFDHDEARARVLAGLDADRGLARNLMPLEEAGWPPSAPAGGRGSRLAFLIQDSRFALRAFGRRPLFTGVAVLAIAIGVASVTAVFSLVDAVLIRTMPLAHFERVAMVWQQDPATGRDRMTLSPLEFQAYRGVRSFDAVAAIRGVRLSVTADGTPQAVSGLHVSPEIFETLGVTPMMGRGFSRAADEAAGEIVITAEFWRTRLGSDPAVLGTPLTLRAGFTADPGAATIDGVRVIVGVLPEGVSLPYRAADVWLPMRPQDLSSASAATGLLVFGRLAPGATLQSASVEAAAAAGQLLAQDPGRSRHVESRLISLRDEVVGDVTPTLILLSAAVALVALIVCANIGNMLLSRLAERQRELTVRRALGATRGRLLQQLFTESAILGLSGGAAGLLLAFWTTRVLAARAPATIPRAAEAGVDVWAFAVALGASLLMSVAFGLLPALGTVRRRGNPLARRPGNTHEGRRVREALTIAEFALAFVVLVGAGLVFVSARALEGTAVGYDPSASLTLRVALPRDGYARPEQRAAFFEALLDRFAALPGVTHAGGVSILPQMDTNRTLEFEIDGASGASALERPSARFRVATPGYFESLGIAVVRGRTFQRSDLAVGAVVVSRSLADRFWPARDPIGGQLRLRLPAGPSRWLTIVGVVEDVRQWINTPPDPTLYWANTQQAEFAFVLRTVVDPATLSGAATRAVRGLDPAQPVFEVQTMQERLERSQQVTYERFRTSLMSAFALMALLLAALGLYGVVRYSVVQRTQEFGIRIALGASPLQVVALVLGQSLRSMAIGAAIGIAGSIAIGRVLAGMLYGGAGAQPVIMMAVAALLAGLAAAAAIGPARRASMVDPLVALRSE